MSFTDTVSLKTLIVYSNIYTLFHSIICLYDSEPEYTEFSVMIEENPMFVFTPNTSSSTGVYGIQNSVYLFYFFHNFSWLNNNLIEECVVCLIS